MGQLYGVLIDVELTIVVSDTPGSRRSIFTNSPGYPVNVHQMDCVVAACHDVPLDGLVTFIEGSERDP